MAHRRFACRRLSGERGCNRRRGASCCWHCLFDMNQWRLLLLLLLQDRWFYGSWYWRCRRRSCFCAHSRRLLVSGLMSDWRQWRWWSWLLLVLLMLAANKIGGFGRSDWRLFIADASCDALWCGETSTRSIILVWCRLSRWPTSTTMLGQCAHYVAPFVRAECTASLVERGRWKRHDERGRVSTRDD